MASNLSFRLSIVRSITSLGNLSRFYRISVLKTTLRFHISLQFRGAIAPCFFKKPNPGPLIVGNFSGIHHYVL